MIVRPIVRKKAIVFNSILPPGDVQNQDRSRDAAAAAQKAVELSVALRIVASVKRISAILTSAFLAVWLVVFSLGSATLVLAFDSPADSAQTTAPADNDDHAEDVVALDDCALQNRRLKLPVRLVTVVRLPAITFSPPVSRPSPTGVLPPVWQFVQRTAASPRAPSFLA
jgi:hypothetical protein